VVIGILIALQINDWNDKRKTKELEIKILKEINNNLLLDIKEIESDVSFMQVDIELATRNIKTYLDKEQQPNDTFYKMASVLRVTPHFDPNLSGYGLLQSKGMEVISNDSLRNSISLLYERAYPYYRRYEEERLRFHALHSEPQLINYFFMQFESDTNITGHFFISQEDYEELKNDSSFKKLLAAISFENSMVIDRGNRTIGAIKNLISFINKEIDNYEN